MRTVSIPDKLYFKIGEVSDITGVKPYVLRYWETEFPEIAPLKSRTNQRLYKKKDVELIIKIQQLLYLERFTINGARKKLKNDFRKKKGSGDGSPQLGLELEKKENPLPVNLQEIKGSLNSLLKEMERSVRA